MKKLKTYLSMVVVLLALNSCLINNIKGQAHITIDQTEENFENVKNLIIKGDFCNVDIDSHNTERVVLIGEIKANTQRDDIKIQAQQNGSSLEIWIERPKTLKGSFSGMLNLKVPTNSNIKVDNSSGDIHVTHIAQASVELMASSGSIDLEHIDCNIKLRTSSGSMTIKQIKGNLTSVSSSGSQYFSNVAGNVMAKVSSGRINMEEIKGQVVSETSSGSQMLSKIIGQIKATASSGSIKINDTQGEIKAKTSSGSIHLNNTHGALNLLSSSGSQHGEEIMLTANSTFKSSSGSIKMALTNEADELSFNLAASSGSLKAKGISGKKHLEIKKGQVLIVGLSSSGSQYYY